MRYKFLKIFLMIIVSALLFTAFSGCVARRKEANSQQEMLDNLQEYNVDKAYIEDALDAIKSKEYGQVHSLLIYKEDSLIFEKYFKGNRFDSDSYKIYGARIDWDKDTAHRVMSVSKSITSAVLGIAIDQGIVESVEQSVFDFFPELIEYKSEGRENIKIKHLLTMTGGIDWDLGNADKALDSIKYGSTAKEILSNPLEYEPGTHFEYNGANTDLVGEIIKRVSGLSFKEYAKKYLFDPLEIDCTWYSNPNSNLAHAAGGAEITPRDMVKLGKLFLDNGVWEGERIISESWIELSTKPHDEESYYDKPLDRSKGVLRYGYFWWTYEFEYEDKVVNTYYASGWGDQNIMVVPEYDMVIVTTGGNYTDSGNVVSMFYRYIIPSVK